MLKPSAIASKTWNPHVKLLSVKGPLFSPISLSLPVRVKSKSVFVVLTYSYVFVYSYVIPLKFVISRPILNSSFNATSASCILAMRVDTAEHVKIKACCFVTQNSNQWLINWLPIDYSLTSLMSLISYAWTFKKYGAPLSPASGPRRSSAITAYLTYSKL